MFRRAIILHALVCHISTYVKWQPVQLDLGAMFTTFRSILCSFGGPNAVPQLPS